MSHQQQKLESIFHLAELLGQQADFDEILRLISINITRIVGAEIVTITMSNPRTQDTIKTILKSENKRPKEFHLAQTNIVGWVMKHGSSFLTENLSRDERFAKGLLDKALIQSAMCVPLTSGGIAIGYLLLVNRKNNGSFSEEDLALLKKSADVCAPFLGAGQNIQRYFKSPLPEQALLEKFKTLSLLGKSPAFIELLRSIEGAAQCNVRVLIEGSTGTGKELVAKSIHKLSARAQGPFVAIDCGAVPHDLVESEFFGYEKGAFTGATQSRSGLFAAAHGGTLFMDEITSLPLNMQSKLLRVLQEDEIRPLGANKVQKVDIRVISAASNSLYELVDQGKFRADLYYRLLVYMVQVPSLAERSTDIPMLAHHFMKKFARQQGKDCSTFQGKVLEYMRQHSWPGNIRELENFVERMVTMVSTDSTIIDFRVLPPSMQKEMSGKITFETIPDSLPDMLKEHEQQLINKALVENNWNQSAAARELGIPEQTLRYKMDKLSISKPF